MGQRDQKERVTKKAGPADGSDDGSTAACPCTCTCTMTSSDCIGQSTQAGKFAHCFIDEPRRLVDKFSLCPSPLTLGSIGHVMGCFLKWKRAFKVVCDSAAEDVSGPF